MSDDLLAERVPVVGTGGIGTATAAPFARAGARGVAAGRAVAVGGRGTIA